MNHMKKSHFFLVSMTPPTLSTAGWQADAEAPASRPESMPTVPWVSMGVCSDEHHKR